MPRPKKRSAAFALALQIRPDGSTPAARPTSRDPWKGVAASLRPPPKLSLSEWADQHFYLSPESSAEPGRWKTLPYQRGILDAITDPKVTHVTVMKSARVGYTKCMNAAIGYFIHQDPCPILVVQPTIEDAEGYSKEEIAPMLRDCEVLAGLVSDQSVKNSAQTILAKSFPGGVLTMGGANSGRAFRRISRRVVIFDEVDGYPPSAGADGDPVKLGTKRTEYYWNRKIIAGSTPLIAGSSRIEEMFHAGDQRRYYVPCPHCGHMDYLRFSARLDDDGETEGHLMKWPKVDPRAAHFMCRKCGCVIDESHKRAMLEAGEWRASAEFTGHASFHIWAAYSLSPNATWGQIAVEFLEAKAKGPEQLKTVINTLFGETWKERGEAPDWERLYQRRETYAIGSLPDGVIIVTAGVDVQKDRLVWEVVGWGANKESWSLDAGEFHGDTSTEKLGDPTSPWSKLDALLTRSFVGEGRELQIGMLGIDSGYNTQIVYNWARRYPMSRVIACKGVAGAARALTSVPSSVDISVAGKRIQRGYKVWPIGVDIAKAELYGWLRLSRGPGAPPDGYCHFPEYGEEFFQQLTAEHLVTTVNKRTRRTKLEWQVLPNRENHFLDTRILARAAAQVLGLDRLVTAPPPTSTPAPSAPSSPPASTSPRSGGGWLGGGDRGPRRGSWLR